MKILYDHQSFTGMSYGGVTRYFFDLMQALAQRPDVQFELSLRFSNNEYLKGADFAKPISFSRFAQSLRANQLASRLNRFYSIYKLRAGQFDIFHPTYYHRYLLKYLGEKPLVITFHDATSERFGKQYPELGTGLFDTKKLLLDRANAVIAISEFTKQEILHFFPDTDPAKIHVVHLGTSFSELSPASSVPLLPFPYVLYVGKRPLYKNFGGFYEAMRPVLARHPDLRLVCAGGGRFTADEVARFRADGLAERVLFEPITDSRLFNLYQHARTFVFPSLNEGFGIPVLEAFSAGCPTVLSDRSSLPEVGADAAVYADPENADALADAVERVVLDDTLRADLRAKGYARLRHFSLDKTAEQTLAVYQKLR